MTLSIVGITHLRYHRWATERVLDVINQMPAELLVQDLKGSFAGIYDTLKHIYQADAVWWDRLAGRPTGGFDAYEAPGCTWELKDAWLALHDKMIDWAAGLTEDEWNRELSYKTMAGVAMVSPIWQMILHIVNHGTYHRGQLAVAIKAAGGTAPTTDFIAWVRAGRP